MAVRRMTPALQGRLLVAVIVVLTAQAILRGLDYLTGEGTVTSTLDVAERALPFWIWGVAFTTGGGLILLALLLRLRMRSMNVPVTLGMLGYGVTALSYLGMGVAILLAVVLRAAETGELTGWRTGTGLLGAAACHVLLALRLRRDRDTHEHR